MKAKVGFFSFTEITDPAEHRSYNEWHMYDHMPEQYPIPGIVYGQRWVCAEQQRSSELLTPTHYMTLYLMTDPLDETLREFYDHGRELARVGRFHQHRRALLSGPFAVNTIAVAPRVLVRAEAVPYRPHRGVHVTVGEQPLDVDALVSEPGVAGAWSFSDVDGGRHITVAWLDGAAPVVDAEFAAAFETISADPATWNWFD